ncbi:hypothetical protein [Oceaniglobus indicus]|uniref:hypothetical protein n=1 Tax=Oceaniglobus indicus TaxID=2047749 RepID=UPI0011AB8125|nr:hypothetical protein [Oceaniglobus indicus]
MIGFAPARAMPLRRGVYRSVIRNRMDIAMLIHIDTPAKSVGRKDPVGFVIRVAGAQLSPSADRTDAQAIHQFRRADAERPGNGSHIRRGPVSGKHNSEHRPLLGFIGLFNLLSLCRGSPGVGAQGGKKHVCRSGKLWPQVLRQPARPAIGTRAFDDGKAPLRMAHDLGHRDFAGRPLHLGRVMLRVCERIGDLPCRDRFRRRPRKPHPISHFIVGVCRTSHIDLGNRYPWR